MDEDKERQIPELTTSYSCPSCGASCNPRVEKCEYCSSYLIRLTALERQVGSPHSGSYFRSLRWLYRLAVVSGMCGAIYLYVIDFDSFSETQLVHLSPLWFLSLHFGLSGLHAERAVRIILSGKATNFGEALVIGLRESAPLPRLVIWLVFTPPFLVFQLNKMSSPLLISLVTSLIWGVMLYLFFLGIFPNL